MHVHDLSGRKIPRMAGSSDQDPGISRARLEDGHVLIVCGDGTARCQREQHTPTGKNLRIAVGRSILLHIGLEQWLCNTLVSAAPETRPKKAHVTR